jgi:methionyl-tRNA formyltransferase
MRIVFIGTVEFSLSALERLVSIGADIVGVCTLKESKFNSDHVDLSKISVLHGIPWLYANDINSVEVMDWIKHKAPDVIFCFGWSKLLKQGLLELAPLGVVGFHPAALPANRGRHPLIWALVMGLKKTASTFFFMDDGADSGGILSQREIEISDEGDASSLYKIMTQVALDQIEEFIPDLISNTYRRQNQDGRLANSWRKRGVADGLIDWRMSAKSIHNLVRGLAKPYVGASFVIDGQEVKVWKAQLVCDAPRNIEPGKVLKVENDKPIIKCGEDAICLLVTEPSFSPQIGSYL